MSKPYPEKELNFNAMALKNIFNGEPESFDGEIPEVKETMECHNHGKVELVYFPIYSSLRDRFNGKPAISHQVSRYCKDCLAAEAARLHTEHESEKKRKLEAAERAEFLEDLEFRGVSLRNSDVRLNDIVAKNPKQHEAINAMKRISSDIRSSKPTGNLILIGSVGTGKTMLTSGLVCELTRDGFSPAIRRVIDIIRKMKNTWRKDSEITEDNLIRNLVGLDLLIIDEIGVQFGSDTEKMFIFDIIDGRYNKMKPTILISNLTMEGIKECIGERCIDRLREDGGKVIAFDFDSQRGRK